MPELPEVETTRNGIAPYILNNKIKSIILRRTDLRWPIPVEIKQVFAAQYITHLKRRGKYLLLQAKPGALILHLGMSGALRIVKYGTLVNKHEHVDITFVDNICLRFTDPRRFGCLLWTTADPLEHPLLKSLGVEPLSQAFNTDYLLQRTRKRKVSIKQLLMNNLVVVGIGNIYANEALFAAGIRPMRVAATLTKSQCNSLVTSVKAILRRAIKASGTTINDFTQSDGKPGYFQQKLHVYGRDEQGCSKCQNSIRRIVIGGRSAFYCPQCQQ